MSHNGHVPMSGLTNWSKGERREEIEELGKLELNFYFIFIEDGNNVGSKWS